MSLVSFFSRGYRNTSVAGNGLRGFTVNPFLTNVPVLYPLKSFGFLMFSGGIEVENWLKMGQSFILRVLARQFHIS